MKRNLLLNICAHKDIVRFGVEQTRIGLNWLNNNFPMDKTLKRTSRFCCDESGEVFLFHDGVYYSWGVIVSIVKENGILTYYSLLDSGINK